MGNCIFCGQPAGFLKKQHKECRQKYEAGKAQIVSLVASSISNQGSMDALAQAVGAISQSHFIDASRLRPTLIEAWESAVERALDDGILTEEEEVTLLQLADQYALTQRELDRNGAYSKVTKAAVLRDVLHGEIPNRIQIEGDVPFNLQKKESLVWVFEDVAYYERRTRRQYVGGHQGVSIRIAKGVYYHTGGFRGQPVETVETIHVDTGLLGVTNKHLYFYGSVKSFRLRYDKIVSFTPYSDGIGVQRDAMTARSQLFITEDGWFTFNLVTNLARLHAF